MWVFQFLAPRSWDASQHTVVVVRRSFGTAFGLIFKFQAVQEDHQEHVEASTSSRHSFWHFIVEDEPDQHYRNLGKYEGWNFNSGNYLFTTDTK